MRRYLVVSILIGIAVSVAVLTMMSLGVFRNLAGSLGDLYAGMGFPVEEDGQRWLERVLVVGLALTAAWCVIDIPAVGQKILVFLLLLVVTAALSPTLALYGSSFEPFSGITALLLATTAAFLYSGTEHGARKRLLMEVLGSRVSRETFHRLLDARQPVRFEAANREVTVLTCRIFQYAELREKLEPSEIVAMGSLFLRNTADFLKERGAYLDESSPELVRAYFGLLETEDDQTLVACQVALELRTRLHNLSQECSTRWFQPLVYGVSIGSGPMTVGVFGSPRRFQFSGLGGETDFSRRLAQANLRYGSDVLITTQVYQAIKDRIAVRPMEMIFDPERHLMMEVYQLIASIEDLTEKEKQDRDAFWEGVVLYRGEQYEGAIARFLEVQDRSRKDGPLEFFLDRCQHRLAGLDPLGGENPATIEEEGHARLLNLM